MEEQAKANTSSASMTTVKLALLRKAKERIETGESKRDDDDNKADDFSDTLMEVNLLIEFG